MESEVAQSCLTLCDPVDWSLPASPSMGFPRQGYGSGLLLPSPGDLPDPEVKPGSPALQADALPSEPLSMLKHLLNSGAALNVQLFGLHPTPVGAGSIVSPEL